MSNASHYLQSSVGIAPAANFTISANGAFAQASTPEEAAWERRWQLEWDRRNVED